MTFAPSRSGRSYPAFSAAINLPAPAALERWGGQLKRKDNETMKPVVTYQSPNGATKTLCAEHAVRRQGPNPITDAKGAEYCNISHGCRMGTCELCAWEGQITEPVTAKGRAMLGLPPRQCCSDVDDVAALRADLAALRDALRVIAEMADEQREHFNEVWDKVDPKNNWDGNAANVRGGYISISGKARAALARVQGKEE